MKGRENSVRIGTAGWAVPRQVAERFPAEGTGLERYAARFDCAEINSSFHRPHRPAIYARWAAATPEQFRFSVKLPKTISHERKLVDCAELLDRFLEETAPLGPKRGPLLLQLPPSLSFDADVAMAFFGLLRARHQGPLACEPRHPSWFGPEPDRLLRDHLAARVAADPARTPAAAEPGGWPGLVYHRLHGSPRVYWSSYDPETLQALATRLAARQGETWCIFDNTASGAAAANALDVSELVRTSATPEGP